MKGALILVVPMHAGTYPGYTAPPLVLVTVVTEGPRHRGAQLTPGPLHIGKEGVPAVIFKHGTRQIKLDCSPYGG